MSGGWLWKEEQVGVMENGGGGGLNVCVHGDGSEVMTGEGMNVRKGRWHGRRVEGVFTSLEEGTLQKKRLCAFFILNFYTSRIDATDGREQ